VSPTVHRTVMHKLAAGGYSPMQIRDGLAYAVAEDATTVREAFILAMSRILYSDEQLADGARYAAEEG